MARDNGLCAHQMAIARSIVTPLLCLGREPICVAFGLSCSVSRSDGAKESCDCSLLMSLCDYTVVPQQLLLVSL